MRCRSPGTSLDAGAGAADRRGLGGGVVGRDLGGVEGDVGCGLPAQLALPVDLGPQGAQDVEDEPDDDEIHPDVEEDRRDELELAHDPEVRLEERRLQDVTTEEERDGPGAGGEEQACTEQPAGLHGGGLSELVAPAGQVPDGRRDAGDEPAGEATAGSVVPGEEQVEREQHHRVEDEPGADLEDHRAALGRQGAGGAEPQPAPGARGLAALGGPLDEPFGPLGDLAAPHAARLALPQLGGAVDARGPGPEEDERGHAGGGGDEDRDLAHGVPRTDVDERDVDDVEAVAVLVGLLGEVDRHRLVDARAGRDEGEARGGDPDDRPERSAPPAGGREDRKSTRLNSSHVAISYAVCLRPLAVPTRRSSDLVSHARMSTSVTLTTLRP